MSERASRLTAFLADGSALPFVWGERDCCLWVSDWIRSVRGADPGAELRGAYSTLASCLRLLRQGGGFETVVSGLIDRAGLARTDTPGVGDVGIVETGVGPMMAICVGERWAFKAVDGIAILPAAPVAAWTV